MMQTMGIDAAQLTALLSSKPEGVGVGPDLAWNLQSLGMPQVCVQTAQALEQTYNHLIRDTCSGHCKTVQILHS
jgi:hypothetical protein